MNKAKPFHFLIAAVLISLITANSSLGESIIGNFSSENMDARSSQRKSFYNSGNLTYYAFYSENGVLKYAYSSNNLSWTNVATTVACPSSDFTVTYFDNTNLSYNVLVACKDTTESISLVTGSITNLEINFSSSPITYLYYTTGKTYSRPSLVIDANDTFWLSAIRNYNGTLQTVVYGPVPAVSIYEGNITSPTESVVGSVSTTLSDTTLLLTPEGRPLLIIGTISGSLSGFLFDGAVWQEEFSMEVGTGAQYSVTVHPNIGVHLLVSTPSGQILYRKRTVVSGVTEWSTALTLATGVSGIPSISLNGLTDNLIAVWSSSLGIRMRKFAQGTWYEELSLNSEYISPYSIDSIPIFGSDGAFFTWSSSSLLYGELVPAQTNMPLSTPTPAPTYRYSVSGFVTKEDNSPLVGIPIRARIDSTSFDVRTNANGFYTIPNLPYGATVILEPKALGYNFTPPDYEFVVGTTNTFDFTAVGSFHTISGQVVNKVTQKQISNIFVDGGQLGTTRTNSEGIFSFQKVPKGYRYLINLRNNLGHIFFPPESFGILEDDINLLFQAEEKSFGLSGVVMYKKRPLPGVVIDGGRLGKVKTNKFGRFKFANIVAGSEYILTPELTGYTFRPHSVSGRLLEGQRFRFAAYKQAIYGEAITRVSVSSKGVEGDALSGNEDSGSCDINEDGQVIAFTSNATNLVDEDTNQKQDVFVRNEDYALTERVSINNNGEEGDGDSGDQTSDGNSVSISRDGRFVAFHSLSTNLVYGDDNGESDVFLFDTDTNTQKLVSSSVGGLVGNGASRAPAVNGLGGIVAFVSDASNLILEDTNNLADIFVRNLGNEETARVSESSEGAESNGASYFPSISSNGNRVAFVSVATNLVSTPTDGTPQIFVRDISSATTRIVSTASDETAGNSSSSLPTISGNGEVIAFASDASNLVTEDTNNARDIFVYDRTDNKISRVSVDSAGNQANGASGFGRISLSEDGRYVAFSSDATNLVIDDKNSTRDIFVHDRLTRRTGLVSRSTSQIIGNKSSGSPVISSEADFVVFTSLSTNLVSEDNNNVLDVYRAPVGHLPGFLGNRTLIEDKPTVVTKSSKITFYMQQFSIQPTGDVEGISLIPSRRRSKMLASNESIIYNASVKDRVRKTALKKYSSKRNTLTLPRLKSSTYSVSYHANLIRNKKTVARTAESPRRVFKVKN